MIMLTKFIDFLFEYVNINKKDKVLSEILFKEGLRYFPNLQLRHIIENKILKNLFYINGGSKAVLTEDEFKSLLIKIKIKNIIKGLGNNIQKVNYSNTTISQYIYIDNIKIRLSDHINKKHDGIDILIKFNTNENNIISKIINKYVNKV
jgi:hypothetical protein